jgi:dipeptidyl aminopeptidase/acylaminoacyl peptidase
MTFSYDPNDGDSELFLRDLEDLSKDPVELSTNGSGPVFSDDSRWLAFTTETGGEGEEQTRTLHLLDLTNDGRWEVENPSSLSFSDDSRWFAVHKSGGGGEGEARGSDLILRNLQDGSLTNLGNVAEVAFNEGSTHLAFVVDAEGRAGNGLFLFDLWGARVVPLSTGDALYQGLSWNESGTALAILRGDKAEGAVQRENQLLTFRGLGPTAAASFRPPPEIYDPAQDSDFPAGFVISEFRAPSWSEDGARVFIGIKEQLEEVEEEEGPKADVVVWHWNDKRVQSLQQVQAGRDRRATHLSVVNLDGMRFFQLATESMEQVQPTQDGRWVIGFDDSRYWWDRDHENNRDDVYRIDPASGGKTLIAESLITSMGTSPDSEWFLYWQDQQVMAYALASGRTVNLTEAAGGVDFENKEFDRPVEKPTYGVGGWSVDGDVVFLNHRFDVWRVPLDGGEAVNLTGGMGERDQIRFRILDLNPEDDGIDTSEPILLSAYGEWTKRSGYYRAQAGRHPEELIYDDAMFGTTGFQGSGIRKAEGSDRVLFTRQTFSEFPDYWVSDTQMRNPRKVTEANPQQAEYLWGSRVLVDYTDNRGHDLQATLTLPADHVEGRRYPMIIYFYEKMSQRHHEYSRPTYDDRPHMSTYASNGYLVLMPDIVYDMGYPGSSSLDDVVSAAQAVIDGGYADPDRICLQGHSWGGYETSFIVTQTDMFACVVTGAPLTNLVSMHNILYKRSGNPNANLIEWGQGRMDTTPFHNLERYVAESPIHNVQGITTPFLILHGTEDGAVDWNQGLEYYIAARRMGKEVILLSYPGEPHHLGREENQKDFQIRMKQYFDHYLKDAPAPTWMTDGVSFLEKDRIGPEDGMLKGG